MTPPAVTTPRVRFAPSPTGLLHVGNARVALVNWLFAHRHGGAFLLRLDDTDVERSTPEFAVAIERDLAWLGLTWDSFARQSDRMDRYQDAAKRLRASGRLYACYETEEELKLRRKTRSGGPGAPQVYDRAGLRLTEEEKRALEAQGRVPHWRFLLEPGRLAWDDLVRGAVGFDAQNLNDPVLIRADGRPIYTLASVVDDIDLGITHVIRGEDHVTNTAVQIALIQALGADPGAFRFAHLPLLSDASGDKLSKRVGSLSLQSLRESGIEPRTLVAYLARLGTSDPIDPALTLDDLKHGFSFERFSRASPKFDPAELERLNARVLHHLDFAEVRERLAAQGLGQIDEEFWQAVRANLSRLSDLTLWWGICRGSIAPAIDDPAFVAEAARLMPEGPLGEAAWTDWTRALGAATGRKGKALFHPLRRALTAREDGPEMRHLLPLIGRERALARLAGETA